jgi:E3 ubiquitin-protein ligase HUWE1
MATFVHNEPTSLGVLQELQLPHALYEELEREIPSTYEVLAAVPNAIGALCLNQAGIDFTLEHAKLLESYVRVAAANESHALQLGINLDELVRHHPALRKTILGGALDLIRATINESRSFVPSEEDRPRYLLDASDIVGESDKAVENDHVNKLASQLNVSPRDGRS